MGELTAPRPRSWWGPPPLQESHPPFRASALLASLSRAANTHENRSHGLDRQTLCEASHWVILPPRQSTPTLPDELFKTELYTLWDKFSS